MMVRKALVQGGAVRRQQIDDAPIFAPDASNEELRLLTKCLPKAVVKIRVQRHRRMGRLQVPHLQPPTDKVPDQCVGTSVGEHATNLPLKDRPITKLAAPRCGEQLVVGAATLQEKRQP
jgi:hypothetical protein